MDGGVGYKPIRHERKRKLVHGERIDETVVQVNMKVSSAGKKSVEELLGIPEEKKAEAEEKKPKEEKKEAPKDETKKETKEKPKKAPKKAGEV